MRLTSLLNRIFVYEPQYDKTNKMSVRPAKTQISLGICPVRSDSSLCAQWVAKDSRFLHADSKDSDQTWWMPRLIEVFAGRTCHFVGFVTCGMYQQITSLLFRKQGNFGPHHKKTSFSHMRTTKAQISLHIRAV